MARSAGTRLGFEALERKQMLAGDVLVSLVNGGLVVEGDELANQIAISSGETAGTYVIQGLDGTAVRLASADPADPPAPDTGLVVEGVKGHVRVGLGDGDDTLIVHDAQFRHGLSIGTGAGADVVRIGAAEDADEEEESEDETAEATLAAAALAEANANVTVRGSLSISTGEGDDTVTVEDASVGGLLNVVTGAGADTVKLGAEAVEAAAATLAAETVASETVEEATLHVRMGVNVVLGDGADAVTIRDVATRGAVAIGGGGDADTIGVHDTIAAVLGIHGGEGEAADQVDVSTVRVHHAAIGLGDGADRLTLVDSAFGSLAVALGAGDDFLSLQTIKAARALLAGGDGEGDELSDAGDNTLRNVGITGFETPADVNVEPTLPRGGGGPGRSPLARLLGKLRR